MNRLNERREVGQLALLRVPADHVLPYRNCRRPDRGPDTAGNPCLVRCKAPSHLVGMWLCRTGGRPATCLCPMSGGVSDGTKVCRVRARYSTTGRLQPVLGDPTQEGKCIDLFARPPLQSSPATRLATNLTRTTTRRAASTNTNGAVSDDSKSSGSARMWEPLSPPFCRDR